jgi:large subunit ribosomal protein L31e
VRILREFVERHMKPEELLIQPEVNDRIWSRGIQKPPRRIRIRATKNSDNLVRVYLAEA